MKPTPSAIAEYLAGLATTHQVFDALRGNEGDVFDATGLVDHFGLQRNTACGSGLFGYASQKGMRTDYSHPDNSALLIEAKYLRCRETAEKAPNECDLKNGLAQIVEQAAVAGRTQAILVVLDAGRARKREMNTVERLYVSMFSDNPFMISLSFVRARIDEELRQIRCEII